MSYAASVEGRLPAGGRPSVLLAAVPLNGLRFVFDALNLAQSIANVFAQFEEWQRAVSLPALERHDRNLPARGNVSTGEQCVYGRGTNRLASGAWMSSHAISKRGVSLWRNY